MEWRYNFTIIYIGTRWRIVVSFMPWPFYSEEFVPSSHWIQSRIQPRAGLEAVEKRKILLLRRFEPEPSSPWPVAVPAKLSRQQNIGRAVSYKSIGCACRCRKYPHYNQAREVAAQSRRIEPVKVITRSSRNVSQSRFFRLY
jgi:hypothetical protein